MFRELDLDIPRVILFGIQSYLFDGIYGPYLGYILGIVITHYAKCLYAWVFDIG